MRRAMGGSHSINLGSEWEAGPSAGGPAWVRRFGRPAGLEPGDAVWLVIEDPAVCGLSLNGAPLPPCVAGRPYRTAITPLIVARNALWLVPSAAAAPVPAFFGAGRGPLPRELGSVRLEIVSAAAAATPRPA